MHVRSGVNHLDKRRLTDPTDPNHPLPYKPEQKTLQSIREISSAYWLDVKEKVQTAGGEGDYFSLEGIIKVRAGGLRWVNCVWCEG